ncbi:hypothetical protein RU86_GL000385 [Lactococcus piscium]|uniref:Nucleotidyltransferase family protein n=1 Tax=Pseudolactococcus piscium TaxID=1364 RepID=A0A2A5RY65_9LACT|nr:nucleotidyltransferase family protein [Lactococcus piscium]PCS06153.1 hypothetical protein RU86_GL000385 [Lactococcus piscium]
MTEAELKALLHDTPEIIAILNIINRLGLADAWLAAGTIRNLIWNYLSGLPLFDQQTDVDVVFFDKLISYEQTRDIEASLQAAYPTYDWELKNQAHMHLHNPNTQPYLSACDAITRFPERCTAIGIKGSADGEITLFTPYGLSDILAFIVRPTPYFLESPEKLSIYQARLAKKNWQEKWPKVTILQGN